MEIQTFGSSRTDTTNATITALNSILNALNTGIFTTLYAETELTVNAAAQVNVLTPAANKYYLVTVKNTSAGGQNIRIGTAPTFAPNVGQLLAPNDTLVLQPVGIAINARANLAGGLLSVLIYESV